MHVRISQSFNMHDVHFFKEEEEKELHFLIDELNLFAYNREMKSLGKQIILFCVP